LETVYEEPVDKRVRRDFDPPMVDETRERAVSRMSGPVAKRSNNLARDSIITRRSSWMPPNNLFQTIPETVTPEGEIVTYNPRSHAGQADEWIWYELEGGEAVHDAKCSMRIELDKFDGLPENWDSWMSAFYGLVHCTSLPDEVKLATLKSKLTSIGECPPALIVQDLNRPDQYLPALSALSLQYGDPVEKRRRQRQKLRDLEGPKHNNAQSMKIFAFKVRSLLAAMSMDQRNNPEDILDDVAAKLPLEEHVMWKTQLAASGIQPTLVTFSNFVGCLAKILEGVPQARKVPEIPYTRPKESDFRGNQKYGKSGDSRKVVIGSHSAQAEEGPSQQATPGRSAPEEGRVNATGAPTSEELWESER